LSRAQNAVRPSVEVLEEEEESGTEGVFSIQVLTLPPERKQKDRLMEAD